MPDQEQYAAYGQPLFGQAGASASWDPSEELARLCRDTMAPGPAEPLGQAVFGHTVGETVSGVGLAADLAPGYVPDLAPGYVPDLAPGFVPGLADGGIPAEGGHRGHRRGGAAKASVLTLLHTGSLCTAVLVAVIAAVVSIFSGLAICEALRHSAGPSTAHGVSSWWPLLIYGPWMVASLSILRAALHQRRALHSWSIVLLFSTLATLLCVAQAPRTFAAEAAATLPPIAALACFQQLVRQITLTRPPRQPAPRHRSRRRAAPLRPSAPAGSPGAVLPDYPGRDRRGSVGAPAGYRLRYGS
ncbi:hypothetical protein ABZW02_11725 [Streptomyces sp. NPDC005180]|uniref:hypothetical protein n=1 Tax=Streptomyces sp. NPDC005180 TaxID=3156868 RepID=UPI0033A957C4